MTYQVRIKYIHHFSPLDFESSKVTYINMNIPDKNKQFNFNHSDINITIDIWSNYVATSEIIGKCISEVLKFIDKYNLTYYEFEECVNIQLKRVYQLYKSMLSEYCEQVMKYKPTANNSKQQQTTANNSKQQQK